MNVHVCARPKFVFCLFQNVKDRASRIQSESSLLALLRRRRFSSVAQRHQKLPLPLQFRFSDAKLRTKKRRRNFHSIAVKFLKVFLKVLAFQRVFLKVLPILAPFSVKFLKVFEGFSESFTVFDQFLRKVSPFLTNPLTPPKEGHPSSGQSPCSV